MAAARLSPEVVAEAIVFAVAQPDLVDIGEIAVRPTVQPWPETGPDKITRSA